MRAGRRAPEPAQEREREHGAQSFRTEPAVEGREC
jgi:hypothetical protein